MRCACVCMCSPNNIYDGNIDAERGTKKKVGRKLNLRRFEIGQLTALRQ